MNRIAAIPTGRRGPPQAGPIERRCSFVEDLNWPAVVPATPHKPSRPTEVWVPGRSDDWRRDPPTLQ